MNKRTGLKIKSHKINKQLAIQFKIFAKWLRNEFNFPIRLPVYLSEKTFVISKDGEECISIFFAPYDNEIEPYIRIATGDYESLICERGQEQAILAILYSLALEIQNYIEWLKNNVSLDEYNATNDVEVLFQRFLDEAWIW